MYTIIKMVWNSEVMNNDTSTEQFHRETVAKERFRKLKREGEYDYLHLWNGRTLARWTYGEEDRAYEYAMTAANTAAAERPWGMDAYKIPVIKDTMP